MLSHKISFTLYNSWYNLQPFQQLLVYVYMMSAYDTYIVPCSNLLFYYFYGVEVCSPIRDKDYKANDLRCPKAYTIIYLHHRCILIVVCVCIFMVESFDMSAIFTTHSIARHPTKWINSFFFNKMWRLILIF